MSQAGRKKKSEEEKIEFALLNGGALTRFKQADVAGIASRLAVEDKIKLSDLPEPILRQAAAIKLKSSNKKSRINVDDLAWLLGFEQAVTVVEADLGRKFAFKEDLMAEYEKRITGIAAGISNSRARLKELREEQALITNWLASKYDFSAEDNIKADGTIERKK